MSFLPGHVFFLFTCILITFQRGNLIGTKGLLKSFRSVTIEEKRKKEKNNINLLLASRWDFFCSFNP